MLERSVGPCYFVTFLLGHEGGLGPDRPLPVTETLLDDDVAFFDTRLAYLVLKHHSRAPSDKWYTALSPLLLVSRSPPL